MEDLATAIENCVTRDGQNSPSANLPMNSYKHTGVTATSGGSSRTEYTSGGTVQDGAICDGGDTGGTSTAFTATLSPAITAYADKQLFRVKFNAAFGANPTINFNSVGAKKMYYMVGSTATQLTTNNVPQNYVGILRYDTSLDGAAGAFLLLNPPRETLGLGSAAAHDAGSQAEVDAGTAARVVEADRLLASPGYGRGFRNAAGRNGGLEVWQRGAGGAASIAVAASTTAYTADGWALKTNANQASVVDQVAGIATGSRWAARVRRNAGQTGTGAMSFELPLDVDEIVALRGNLVTLSLTLQAGANWSPASGNLTIELRTGTGTPAKRSAGAYTGEAAAISQAQAITTSPTRYSFTSAAAIDATVTQASIYLTWTPAGTAGAADDFTIDDVQLEIGLARTTFERLPFALELLLCQRHFWKTFKYDVAPAQNAGSPTADHQWGAQRAGAASNFGFLPFPVVMRSAPTITFFNPSAANAQARDLDAAADCSSTSGIGTVRGMRFTTVGNASTAIGNTLAFHATADAGI